MALVLGREACLWQRYLGLFLAGSRGRSGRWVWATDLGNQFAPEMVFDV